MGDEEMDEWGVWFLIVQSLTGGCIFLAPPPCREVCVLTRPEIQFRGRADCLPRGHHTLKKGRLVYTNYATLGTNPKPRLHAMFLARTCMVNRQHVSFFFSRTSMWSPSWWRRIWRPSWRAPNRSRMSIANSSPIRLREKSWWELGKTRCSPRTRMQSRRTLLSNKLFEQSTFFPCDRTSAL